MSEAAQRIIIGGPLDGMTWATANWAVAQGMSEAPESSRTRSLGQYVHRKYVLLDDTTVLDCWVWDADIKTGEDDE